MTLVPFFNRQRSDHWIEIPPNYRTTTRWIPRIGDSFPNFSADSTQGPLTFHPWAEGSWCVLFSFAAAFTPVCTSELRGMAAAQDELEQMGVKLLGMSRDDVTTQKRWLDEIAQETETPPRFPLMGDRAARLSRALGMIHPRAAPGLTVRKTVIVDPKLRVRMIFEYPITIGRSTEELLRTVEALQFGDAQSAATPADWLPGEDCITIAPATTARDTALRPLKRLCRFG